MFLYILCILFVSISGKASLDVRIVGGSPASINQYPHQVSLHVDKKFKCGASIINPYWAITTAECIKGLTANKVSLRAGSNLATSGGTMYTASKIITHEQFNSVSHVNDIALIQVTVPFEVSKPEISTIDLPLQDESVPAGKDAIITGFGKFDEGSTIIPQPLHQTTVPIVSNEVCKNSQPGVTATMVCAGYTTGGQDTCIGDEGGPLVLNKKLVGITSWGLSCGKSGKPSVYTKVSSFRNWIKSKSGV